MQDMKQFFKFHCALVLMLGWNSLNAAMDASQPNRDFGGLPNISTRTLSARGSWDVFGDFLVWYASEQSTAIWANVLTTNITKALTFNDGFLGKIFNFDWDFGFRTGVGYNMPYDQWDSQLFWSWFRTNAHSSVPNGPPAEITTVIPQFFNGFILGDFSHKAEIQWNLLYNMFDWELGRSYWVSKGLSFRPFLGLKGGWINQKIHSKWQVFQTGNSPDTHAVNYTAIEDLKNNFWGIGPSGGINTKWNLNSSATQFVSFFGDFSLASLWGSWLCKEVYNNPTPIEMTLNMKRFTLGSLMCRGFLGLGWETDINQGRSHFSTRVGYEMQIWFSQLRMPTLAILPLHGDLTIQGGTFNCRFDF